MKKKIIISISIIFVIVILIVTGIYTIKRTPLAAVTKENTANISYHIIWYENESPVYLTLPENKQEEFFELTDKITITGFGSDYHKKLIGGTNLMLKVELNNGEQIAFASCQAEKSGYIINDKFYLGDADTSKELYDFWRELAIQGRKEYGLEY